MEEVTLVAQPRAQKGSAASRRLRVAGKIPAVLYGHGTEPQALTVDGRELRGALTTEAGVNALISLQLDGNRQLAMARELQRHPVRGTVDHVDFVVVRRDEVVSADVPLHLVGEATEVQRNEGVLDQQLFALAVRATPMDIPAGIEVDISALTIGDAIRVGDLTLPANVTTEVDPEEPVVAVQASRVADEIEAVEGAEAEGAAEAAAEAEGASGGEQAGADSGEG
ncbi:MAG: 50S ribosomal protein L25 [Actinomycetota bacterium]|nr:50S ribosomal protein L25 [Actinomycetota bacterium]